MKYTVELTYRQISRQTVLIEAPSLYAAKQRAEEIQSDHVEVWDGQAGELIVDDVRPSSRAEKSSVKLGTLEFIET